MSVVATLVLVLLVAAWWIAAARSERLAARTPAGPRDAPRAVFGRGVLTTDGRWRPVGLPGAPGAEPDPGVAEAGDRPAAEGSGRLPAPRDGVVL